MRMYVNWGGWVSMKSLTVSIKCRLQTGYKMQTRYKMQTDTKTVSSSNTT